MASTEVSPSSKYETRTAHSSGRFCHPRQGLCTGQNSRMARIPEAVVPHRFLVMDRLGSRASSRVGTAPCGDSVENCTSAHAKLDDDNHLEISVESTISNFAALQLHGRLSFCITLLSLSIRHVRWRY